MKHNAQRLDIQGLRALALIVILLYHARLPIPGGYVALDMFFVISGFVITQMLMREFATSGRIDFRRFYIRRFRRLTPALAVMVGVVLFVAIFLQSPFGQQQVTAATGAGALLFVANIVIANTTGDYFDVAADLNPLLHTWSLSVEEQFYFVFPAVLVGSWLWARRSGRGQSLPVLILLFLAVTTFLFAVFTTGSGPLDWPLNALSGYYGALGRAWEFAAGAVLALLAKHFLGIPRWSRELMAWAGMAAILVAMFTFSSATPYPGVATLVPVLGTSAMIIAGTAGRNSFSSVMSTAPMVRIGDMSYSWYLWHWPVIVFAIVIWPNRPILAPIVAVIVSFIPAYLSYRFVEAPLRSAPIPRPGRLITLAGVSIGVPLALAALLTVGARNTWGVEWPTSYDYRDAAPYAQGCHDTEPDLERCTWTVPNAQGTVFVLGDSQALSLSDGVIEANKELGFDTFVSSASQCPFILPGYVEFDYPNDVCQRWQQEIIPFTLAAKPDVVVIANRPYIDGATGGVRLVPQQGLPESETSSNESSSDLWSEALGGLIQTLRARGIGVVLAQAPPEPAYEVPVTGIIHLGRDRSTRQQALAQRERAFALDQGIAQAHPGSVMLDPLPVLCDETICPDILDGEFLYADPRHLSVAGAKRLTEALAQSVSAAYESRMR
jgi:peptidoglycan/LPS O-acetylase OafA/YrhL